jgi:hypothetical protein
MKGNGGPHKHPLQWTGAPFRSNLDHNTPAVFLIAISSVRVLDFGLQTTSKSTRALAR